MSQRLSRKEIKRDELKEAVEHAVDYATSHTRLIVQIAVAVLVVVALGVGIFLYLGYRSDQAREALARAIQTYDAPIDAANPQPADEASPTFADEASRRARAGELFSEIQGRFGGTDAGAIARAYLGRIALEEGQPDRARELWQEVLDGEPRQLLAAEVHLNLLKLDLQQGRAEEAAARLEGMLLEVDKPVPEDLILFELASVRERQGRTDEALSAYQRIVDEFPRSPYSAPAQQKTRSLAAAQSS